MELDNRHEFETLYSAFGRKTQTERQKLLPRAGILPVKFQLEGPFRFVSNYGPLARYFLFYQFNFIN